MKLTWNKNNKKRPLASISQYPNLPFDQLDEDTQQHKTDTEPKKEEGNAQNQQQPTKVQPFQHQQLDPHSKQLFELFQAQGNKLAEEGEFRKALGKWEAALNLMPENAVLHEQKAQVLLEIGDAWNALKAATRELLNWNHHGLRYKQLEVSTDWVAAAPTYAMAWITLGRAQLNFGEPDSAIESFDKALAIKPDSEEARDDRHTALQLVKRRKQLQSTGLSTTENRYAVSDKTENS